jgi:hypothetical protein
MLRWVFRRANQFLTCELDVRAPHTFDVCIVPHWDVSGSVVERFGDAVAAMERHAAIARALRRAGWTVVEHASPDFMPAAA